MAQEPIPPLQKILADLQIFVTEASTALSTWYGNFTRNTSEAFERMTLKNWIRLVIIVCTYCLIRPYILKLGAKVQQSQLEKEARESEEKYAALNGNDLRTGKKRGKVDIPGVDSESEEGEPTVEGEWGRKARLRQRKIVRKAMEIHEANLTMKATESDHEIEDLLED